MKSERKACMFKVESPYGTDSTPAGGTDAFQAIDFEWGSSEDRTGDTWKYSANTYGAEEDFTVSLKRSCAFDIPVIGAGTPLGTNYPAPLLALYRAAGHASAVTASTSVTFNPVSAAEEGGTFVANEDGLQRRMVGSRANMKWTFPEGKVPRCRVELMGLYSTPSDQSPPSITLPSLQKPIGFNNSNTVITLGGTAIKCLSAEINGGRTYEYRNIAGDESFLPVDCLPTVVAKFEMPTVAQRNLAQQLETTARQALSIAHGVTAGNRFTFAAALAELTDMKQEKDRGILVVTCTFKLRPSAAGNDQYTITIT